MNRVFNVQPGPTLRQYVAQGQMSAYSADVVYACWLLYRVCCTWLTAKWDEGCGPPCLSKPRR